MIRKLPLRVFLASSGCLSWHCRPKAHFPATKAKQTSISRQRFFKWFLWFLLFSSEKCTLLRTTEEVENQKRNGLPNQRSEKMTKNTLTWKARKSTSSPAIPSNPRNGSNFTGLPCLCPWETFDFFVYVKTTCYRQFISTSSNVCVQVVCAFVFFFFTGGFPGDFRSSWQNPWASMLAKNIKKTALWASMSAKSVVCTSSFVERKQRFDFHVVLQESMTYDIDIYSCFFAISQSSTSKHLFTLAVGCLVGLLHRLTDLRAKVWKSEI